MVLAAPMPMLNRDLDLMMLCDTKRVRTEAGNESPSALQRTVADHGVALLSEPLGPFWVKG